MVDKQNRNLLAFLGPAGPMLRSKFVSKPAANPVESQTSQPNDRTKSSMPAGSKTSTFYAKTSIRYGDNMNKNMMSKAYQYGKNQYDTNPVVRNVVNEGANRIREGVTNAVRSSTSGGGKGISVTVTPPSSNAGNGMGYLSEAPNPAQTRLNTGIKLTAQEKNYTKAQENVCSPLHTTHVKFMFPTSTASLVYDWFSKIETRDVQTRVQETVNWAVNINTTLSAANIMTAMNDLFYALQVYFFYRSVDAYCAGGFNQNDGMYSIQAEFDFNTRMKIAEIARLLSRTPIPPNMLEFCRYMSSNYFSGDTPGSSLLLVVPFARNSSAVLTSNSNLDTVISTLTNTTNCDVWNNLGRACKSWIPGDPANVYDPPIDPVFDKDFITIFNNLPFATGITGKIFGPHAADNISTVSYMSWNNNLDGIAMALTDVYNFTTSEWANGTVSPLASSGHSRFSYYVVSGVYGWYPSRTYPFLEASRLDTYTSNGTILSSYHRFGSDMVINVTGLMLSTTVINAIDYWLSIHLIKGTNVQNDSNPGRRRRRK